MELIVGTNFRCLTRALVPSFQIVQFSRPSATMRPACPEYNFYIRNSHLAYANSNQGSRATLMRLHIPPTHSFLLWRQEKLGPHHIRYNKRSPTGISIIDKCAHETILGWPNSLCHDVSRLEFFCSSPSLLATANARRYLRAKGSDRARRGVVTARAKDSAE